MTAIPHPLVVLLVDDDENDIVLIGRALARLDKRVRLSAVNDGEQAIAYLQGTGEYADRNAWPLPNVLLLDHWMPRVCGLDVLCWLRTYPPLAHLPVVILSGGLSPAQAVLMEQLNAVCCQKQVGLDAASSALADAIRGALAARKKGGRPAGARPILHSDPQ
jgi:CheY-like chemotaxis protein